MNRKTPLLLIVGLSGVGKTAILRASKLSEVISDTSRPMREGETDGIDYNFLGRMDIDINKYKHLYKLDPPKLNYSNYYCAKDSELIAKDAFIVDINTAIRLRGCIDSVIVWIDGEARQDRGRTETVPEKVFIQNYDYRINNNGTLEDAIRLLERHHEHACRRIGTSELMERLKACRERCKGLERQLYNKGRN